ncbi:aldose 1-epimerase [Paenibacillus eucommiae]|uniref:Aldose 1-epimerase n=1 Tax=Paenibacillus eucommiae TaxID=1355755 RepID=A0ABS4IWU4_9BACL|nr:aldose 1-epimerase [Paenibacillus eucommiae]MBP1992058.1 aldose 1-epimerase [Paenibacillus eucommiae]
MIQQEDWQGVPIYTVSNDVLSFSLCPSINNNLFRVWDKKLNREVLRVPESPQTLKDAPVHYGTPILFPPNRIRRGAFEYDGRNYQFPINTANENHIHGLIGHLPWQVTNISEESDHLSITSTFRTEDFPEVLKHYPNALTLEVTYELRGTSLIHTLKATNNSSTKAPFGYGLHTWFLLDHAPQNWTFELPVSGVWELDKELIPNGTILPLGRFEELSEGISLENQDLDTVFQIGDHERLAVLKQEGCEVRYSASDIFKHWVIYTKGQADNYICLEPYTWVTDAPNSELDPSITGLTGVEPGETLELEIKLDIVHT